MHDQAHANKSQINQVGRFIWRVNLGETAARSKWDAAADWRSNGRLDSFRVQGISDCRCLRILIDARVLPC